VQPNKVLELPDRTAATSSLEPATAPSLTGLNSANFYEENYQLRLSKIIEETIVEAGPLREDRLVQHVARLHNFQRAGREIRERILALVPKECARTRETVGVFVWPIGTEPKDWKHFRHPSPGSAVDPAELPLQELIALAKTAAASNASDDIVLVAMRSACGLSRMGEPSRARYLLALNKMRADAASAGSAG